MGDWYVSPSRVYLIIYGSIKEPHQLPHYVPDKLVLLEISYQTCVTSFGVSMMRNIKIAWPKLSLQVGLYKIENVK